MPTVDEYLEALPDDQRVALEKLRRTIRSTAPGAAESISYGLPMFKHNGKPLIYYGAAKKHCAIYGGSIDAYRDEFQGYDVSKGTVRFTPNHPLPAALVKKMVKGRMKEIEAGNNGYGRK